jgi:hypothetical protein
MTSDRLPSRSWSNRLRTPTTVQALAIATTGQLEGTRVAANAQVFFSAEQRRCVSGLANEPETDRRLPTLAGPISKQTARLAL